MTFDEQMIAIFSQMGIHDIDPVITTSEVVEKEEIDLGIELC